MVMWMVMGVMLGSGMMRPARSVDHVLSSRSRVRDSPDSCRSPEAMVAVEGAGVQASACVTAAVDCLRGGLKVQCRPC